MHSVDHRGSADVFKGAKTIKKGVVLMRKALGNIFCGLAVLLVIVMCVVIISGYQKMKQGIEFEGYSAPTGVVFLYAIPFLIGSAACLIIAFVLRRKK